MKTHSGFSLLEVLVASTLLATSVAVIFGAFVSAHKFPKPEIGRGFGTHLVREKLEELAEAVRQDWWPAANKPLTIGLTAADSVTYNGTAYARSYTVSGVAGKDYRKVQITVSSP